MTLEDRFQVCWLKRGGWMAWFFFGFGHNPGSKWKKRSSITFMCLYTNIECIYIYYIVLFFIVIYILYSCGTFIPADLNYIKRLEVLKLKTGIMLEFPRSSIWFTLGHHLGFSKIRYTLACFFQLWYIVWVAPLKINMSPKKGTISQGNFIFQQVSVDMLVFGGVFFGLAGKNQVPLPLAPPKNPRLQICPLYIFGYHRWYLWSKSKKSGALYFFLKFSPPIPVEIIQSDYIIFFKWVGSTTN